MTAILALLPTLYPLVRDGVGDVAALIQYIRSIRSAAQQSAEWTDAQEAQFQTELEATLTDSAYQPDK